MKSWLFFLLLYSSTTLGNSINIEKNQIIYRDGIVFVDYQITLSANPKKVQALLNDYERFPQISRLVTKSSVITDKNNHQILQQRLRPCALGVCYSLFKTQQLLTDDSGFTKAVIVPQQTYFHQGFEQWKITASENGTRIHYIANMTPAFRLPDFFGNWLFRSFIEDEIDFVAQRIEESCDQKVILSNF